MKSYISKDAKAYLQKRKYDNIDIEKYSISFISKDEESFNKFCKKNEITKDDLQRLGFISSNGNMLFKNRIMFPILSFRNNIIAFGGRAIDDFGPKYLNSSDSVLYKKNRNLYFTNEFITATKKKGYAFIVEGYFDVLSLNKLGYANSASPSGTALTYQQLESVSKYTSKILICFDNDEAGLKRTWTITFPHNHPIDENNYTNFENDARAQSYMAEREAYNLGNGITEQISFS